MASTIRDSFNNSVGAQATYAIVRTSREYHAESFTPTSDYNITQITIYLTTLAGREPVTPYIAEIRAAANTTPNSTVLLSKEFDPSGVTLDRGNPTQFDIVFDTSVALQSGTKYSFVISKPSPVGSEELWIGLGSTQNYSGGQWWRSSNNSNWINPIDPAVKALSFGIWGVDVEPPSSQYPESRPPGYDPDKVWDPDADGGFGGFTSTLSDLTTLGGGRYNKQLVVLGNKKLFFGEL